MTGWRIPKQRLAWLAVIGAAVLMVSAAKEAVSATFRLYPEQVDIGAFFQGAEVTLKGEMPPECDAVLEVCGPAVNEKLLRKGRRAGLWMAVGEVEVQDAPNFYLVLSSTPQIPVLNGQETPWGFSALKSRMRLRGALADEEITRFSQEFLALKESEQLYGSLPGALKVQNSPEGHALIKGAFHLPAKIPPGQYQVRLFVVKDGRILEQASKTMEVKMVGFPALLAALAYEHGALYGVMAAVIAVATGFLMGFLFKGKAEH